MALDGGRLGRVIDVLIAAASAVGFASKGVFAKLLYADGWDYESVLTVRALAALPLVWLWALWRVGPAALVRIPAGMVAGIGAAGVLCYAVGVLLNFYALTLISASVERVLLFAYPSMVVLLHAALYRRRPARAVLVALALTYAGILLVVTGLDFGVLKSTRAGAGFVLASAFTFAVYYLASERWTGVVGSIPFTVVALTAATAVLASYYGARHGLPVPPRLDARDLGLLAGLVVLATVLPMLLMAEGVRRLGAQRSAVVSTIGPPATLLFGALFLNERLSPGQWSGVALILAGIVALETRRAAGER